MQKIRYIVALVLVAHAFSLFAQSGKVKKAYNTAKQFLSQKNYELAMTYFDQVRKVKTKNPLAPNAHFYYAQCALLSNRLEDAKQNFELVLNQYPDFGGIDEIHYALADIAFQASADDQAIRHLQKIQATDFKKDIQGLKGHYAVKMNVMRLRLLNQIFPQDTLIAQCLVDKIAATSEKADELSLIEGLVSQMNLEAPKALKTPKKVFRKPRYKVAVIFPFDTERLKKGDTSAVSRLSIGLYQGMRTAQQELDTLEGTKLELYAYELKRDGEDALKKMLEEKEFDDIDIIIGPLFENLYKIVADFAAKRQIQVINPISIDNKLLINNFTYLYESTVETQAQKITEFVKKNFENPNTLIFYDNLSKNKNLATF
jgi:tetratricopeptide (TPR) repeat protein